MKEIRTDEDWINLLKGGRSFKTSNPYWENIPIAERTFEVLSKPAKEILKKEHNIIVDFDNEEFNQVEIIARKATVVILTASEEIILEALKNAVADDEYMEICKKSCNWLTTLLSELIKRKDYSNALIVLSYIQSSEDYNTIANQVSLFFRLKELTKTMILYGDQELANAGRKIEFGTIEGARDYLADLKDINPILEELLRKTHKLQNDILTLNVTKAFFYNFLK